MDYWQQAPLSRGQLVLFATTLEERIPEDHPVRLLDEILSSLDWTTWEARYDGRRGQPPIHPQVLAAVILYGQMRRIRSSRQLEYAVGHNIDFIWLVSGRSIDHSTICTFRTKFKKELKQVYKQICRAALDLGLIRLVDVALDGTRVLANNNRLKTLTASKVEALLKDLGEQLERGLEAAELADATDELLMDPEESLDRLPPELADLKQRQAMLEQVLEQCREADKARRREGINPTENPAQIPSTDPDSRILPNKEGGYAANYTPMAAIDVGSGFIVSAAVLAGTAEQTMMVSMLEDIEETFGSTPNGALADGIYPTGENLQALDEKGIELFSPLPGPDVDAENPAIREDPTKPVAAEDHAKLPINPQSKRLHKSAFIYNEEEDRYYCPDGRPLDFEQTKTDTRRGQRTSRRVYRSADCSGCPLIDMCQLPTARRGRTISRDVHEKRRQAHAKKMATAAAKERYSKRFHAGEVPFAILKHIMNLRRFLLRGIDKVETEWLWGCTAFNLKKLIRAIAELRAQQKEMPIASVE